MIRGRQCGRRRRRRKFHRDQVRLVLQRGLGERGRRQARTDLVVGEGGRRVHRAEGGGRFRHLRVEAVLLLRGPRPGPSPHPRRHLQLPARQRHQPAGRYTVPVPGRHLQGELDHADPPVLRRRSQARGPGHRHLRDHRHLDQQGRSDVQCRSGAVQQHLQRAAPGREARLGQTYSFRTTTYDGTYYANGRFDPVRFTVDTSWRPTAAGHSLGLANL